MIGLLGAERSPGPTQHNLSLTSVRLFLSGGIVLAVPLLVMLVSLPAGVGAVELKYHGLEPGNSNRWPGKGLLTDPGVAWVLHGHFSAGTVADNGIVLVSSSGEVELVDPKAGKVVRRLAVIPGLRGPLLVARVKGRELVVGTRLPTQVSRPEEVRCELVTVNQGSGGVESVRLPAVEGSVVGCLDVDGDGDDEALVLSRGALLLRAIAAEAQVGAARERDGSCH